MHLRVLSFWSSISYFITATTVIIWGPLKPKLFPHWLVRSCTYLTSNGNDKKLEKNNIFSMTDSQSSAVALQMGWIEPRGSNFVSCIDLAYQCVRSIKKIVSQTDNLIDLQDELPKPINQVMVDIESSSCDNLVEQYSQSRGYPNVRGPHVDAEQLPTLVPQQIVSFVWAGGHRSIPIRPNPYS